MLMSIRTHRLGLSVAAALSLSGPVAAQTPTKPSVIYTVEQIVGPPLPAELMAKIKPMQSLQEVEDLLKANSVQFAWRKAELDASTQNPELIAQIEALPP